MNPERLTWDQLPTLPSSVDTPVPEFDWTRWESILSNRGVVIEDLTRRLTRTIPRSSIQSTTDLFREQSEVTGNPSTSGPVQEHPGSRP